MDKDLEQLLGKITFALTVVLNEVDALNPNPTSNEMLEAKFLLNQAMDQLLEDQPDKEHRNFFTLPQEDNDSRS